MIKKSNGEKLENNIFSKIGFNYLILAVVAILCQIIIMNIMASTNSGYLNDINIITVISSICNYILPFPIFYLLMKELESQTIEKQSLNISTFIIYVAITLTLMWIGNIVGLLITSALSGALQNEIANPVQNLINSTDLWVNFILISIIAPIFEEILFRKLLIDRTIKYGINVSIILSATLFALIHGNLNQFFYAFLLGAFLAYIYTKTGKITYPIILHGIVNFMGSVASIFVAQAATNLKMASTPIDAAIILTYIIILLISIIIGIYGLTKFRPKKPELPLKTLFVNYGMICFIGFSIFEILRQMFNV